MLRDIIERSIDHALTFAFGLFALFLFIAIHLFGIIGVYEDNLPLRYSELSLGGLILAWSIYRFVKMITYYRKRSSHTLMLGHEARHTRIPN